MSLGRANELLASAGVSVSTERRPGGYVATVRIPLRDGSVLRLASPLSASEAEARRVVVSAMVQAAEVGAGEYTDAFISGARAVRALGKKASVRYAKPKPKPKPKPAKPTRSVNRRKGVASPAVAIRAVARPVVTAEPVTAEPVDEELDVEPATVPPPYGEVDEDVELPDVPDDEVMDVVSGLVTTSEKLFARAGVTGRFRAIDGELIYEYLVPLADGRVLRVDAAEPLTAEIGAGKLKSALKKVVKSKAFKKLGKIAKFAAPLVPGGRALSAAVKAGKVARGLVTRKKAKSKLGKAPGEMSSAEVQRLGSGEVVVTTKSGRRAVVRFL